MILPHLKVSLIYLNERREKREKKNAEKKRTVPKKDGSGGWI